jgi:hypothetical protein
MISNLNMGLAFMKAEGIHLTNIGSVGAESISLSPLLLFFFDLYVIFLCIFSLTLVFLRLLFPPRVIVVVSADVYDENYTLVMGLVWSLIYYYQLQRFQGHTLPLLLTHSSVIFSHLANSFFV